MLYISLQQYVQHKNVVRIVRKAAAPKNQLHASHAQQDFGECPAKTHAMKTVRNATKQLEIVQNAASTIGDLSVTTHVEMVLVKRVA